MQKNEGVVERVLRVLLGLALLSLLFLLEGKARYIGLVGILPILTGATGICPVYTLLGISTREKR